MRGSRAFGRVRRCPSCRRLRRRGPPRSTSEAWERLRSGWVTSLEAEVVPRKAERRLGAQALNARACEPMRLGAGAPVRRRPLACLNGRTLLHQRRLVEIQLELGQVGEEDREVGGDVAVGVADEVERRAPFMEVALDRKSVV